MRIRISKDAASDLKSIKHYISQNNASAAEKVIKKIFNAIDHLEHHPNLGRIGRIINTRELVINGTSFIALYEIIEETIWILQIVHGARQWLELID